MIRKTILFLFLFLIIGLSFTVFYQVEAQTQTTYSLDLQGPAWNHSTINILINPQSDKSWWNPDYLDATLRAIDEWNSALSYFASNRSDFVYLSNVKMTYTISNSMDEPFDTILSWIEQFGNETCEAGLTRTSYDSSGLIFNTTLTMSAYDCRGNILNDIDMQNVALHELGHVLGLGHANSTSDLMYFAYTLGNPVRSVSTLDTYGVGVVFRWLAKSTEFNQDNQGDQISSVNLPSDIAYEALPIPINDIPPQSALGPAQMYFVDFLQFILQPVILTSILLAVAALLIYSIVARGRRKHVI
ncbi:MAG: matrixin family metalloprotease [Chloroflexota bacterium]